MVSADMSVIANITTSVDGYIAGPDDGPGKGLVRVATRPARMPSG
jgi:hypothetical protein